MVKKVSWSLILVLLLITVIIYSNFNRRKELSGYWTLEYALQIAGNHRRELEKVLQHYKDDSTIMNKMGNLMTEFYPEQKELYSEVMDVFKDPYPDYDKPTITALMPCAANIFREVAGSGN